MSRVEERERQVTEPKGLEKQREQEGKVEAQKGTRARRRPKRGMRKKEREQRERNALKKV